MFAHADGLYLAYIGTVVTNVANIETCKVHCILETAFECQALLYRGYPINECYLGSEELTTGAIENAQANDKLFVRAGKNYIFSTHISGFSEYLIILSGFLLPQTTTESPWGMSAFIYDKLAV